MKRIAVLAGSAAQARVWLYNKIKEGGILDTGRMTARTEDGATEWRYVGTANAARGVEWTGMEMIGTWGERTDAQAHMIWTRVFDQIQQTEPVAR